MEKLFGLEMSAIAGALSTVLVLVIASLALLASAARYFLNWVCARSPAAGRNPL